MKIKKSELNKNTIRWTVKLNNLSEGTVTQADGHLIVVNDYQQNVQFKDGSGNNVGRNGYVEEILKIEAFDGSEFVECKIE